MENAFDHLFRFLKNFEVKAEPNTRKKKRWLLSREYLQPLDESDDENSGVIQDHSPPSGNAKLRQTYEAAKYGMKQGVLTGVFLGGSWGIFRELNENTSLHLTADSSGSVKDGKTEKKDPEIDTRSYTIIQKDESSQIDLNSSESVPLSKEVQPPPAQTYRDFIVTTRKNLVGCPAENKVYAKSMANSILDKDNLSKRQPCNPPGSKRYGFRKPVEKIEIVGYAFIETTGCLSGAHSSSGGSNQSDGSDSSGSATVRENESKDRKKSMGSPDRAENPQKNNFQREENSTFEKSHSSTNISDTIKHSVISMAEKSIKQWRHLEQNESEIMSKVESNQSQELPKWAEYSISSLPDILETSNFSSVDFEQDDQRRASLVRSLPRSASVLEEHIERFKPVNLLSSTFSKSVEARSSKHRKHEIKWGKIFEKPRMLAPDYDSDHNFITSLKLSFLVDADAVSNGYDSDIAVNSTHATDDSSSKTAKTGRKSVFGKKNSMSSSGQGGSPKEAQDDHSKNDAVSPKFFKASKTILKHNESEKSSHELNRRYTHKAQNRSMLNIESPGYSRSFDHPSDHFGQTISSSDFSESQMTEFREQSSFGEDSYGLIGPHATMKPDHSSQGSAVKFSKSFGEEQYQKKYDFTDTEDLRPHTTDKTDRGHSRVDFVDNKPYVSDTTDRHSPKESGSKFVKPRAEAQYQSKHDLSDTINTRPNTTEKIDRDHSKVSFKSDRSVMAPANSHSPNNSKFSKSRAEEQHQNKHDLVDTEDPRPHTTDKTDRGHARVDFVDNNPYVADTTDRHSPKESGSKFVKPRAEAQYQSKHDLSDTINTRPHTTEKIDRDYSKVSFTNDRSVMAPANSHSPKSSKFSKSRAEEQHENKHDLVDTEDPRPHTTDKTDRRHTKSDFANNRSYFADTSDRHPYKEPSFRSDRSEIPRAQEQRKFSESYVNETSNGSRSQNTVSKTPNNHLKPKPVPYVPTGVDSQSPKNSDSELFRPRAEAKESTKHNAPGSTYFGKKISFEKSEKTTPTLIIPEVSETDQRECNEISSAYFGRRTAELPPPLTKRTSLGGSPKKSIVNFNENKGSSVEEGAVSSGAQSAQRTDVAEKKPIHSFNVLSSLNDNIIILSACNCAIVLGVICCVISATRATLSV